MDINERVDRIEMKIENLENKFNEAIPEIQSGIREIKVMLQERPIQENLKNNIIEKEIETLATKYDQKISSAEERIKKIEDSQVWLRRCVIGALIGLVIEVIVFVVKMM
ncbi:MAG: hemolysin XhlA family protein [Clostridia bacterium]|nr:hemolysin XhlA family protein [Clostridia bacterium]